MASVCTRCQTPVAVPSTIGDASLHHKHLACLIAASDPQFDSSDLPSRLLRLGGTRCSACALHDFDAHCSAMSPSVWSAWRFTTAAAALHLADDDIRSLRLAIRSKARWVSFASPAASLAAAAAYPPSRVSSLPRSDDRPLEGMITLPDLTDTDSMVTEEDLSLHCQTPPTRAQTPRCMPDPFNLPATSPDAVPSRSASSLSRQDSLASLTSVASPGRDKSPPHILYTRATGYFNVDLDDGPDLFSRDAFNLLHDNPDLAQLLDLAINHGAKRITVTECHLNMLHLIYKLHLLQLQGQLDSTLRISVLDFTQLQLLFSNLRSSSVPSSAKRVMPSAQHAASVKWHKLCFTRTDEAHQQTPSWQAPPPRSQAAADTSSSIQIRFCANLEQVFDVSAPLRMLYLPSIMWFHEVAAHSDIVRTMPLLLHYLAAQSGSSSPLILYPPMARDEMTEHKPAIYRRFSDVMIPTSWFELTDVTDDAIGRMAIQLIEAAAGSDGRFVIKGGYSCAGLSVDFFDITGGVCKDLLEKVRRLVFIKHQRRIGLQPFMSCLRLNEIRHFCIPLAATDSQPARWLISFAVRTYWPESGGVTAESCAPLHEDTIATHLLVDQLLADPRHRAFFGDLFQLGVPMLRIDCSYDYQQKRAFLNEFSQAPDATMWTHVHHHDAIYFTTSLIAQQVARLLIHEVVYAQ